MSQIPKFDAPTIWPLVRLGDHLTLINGRAYAREELLDTGTPVLRIQNLNGGDRWYYSDLSLPDNKYCEKGDLLYAWSATFGPYLWDGPRAIFHYHIWKIIPGETIDARYAFWMLDWITASVKSAAHGVTMVHITKGSMEDWRIPLPPLGEQKRIARILDVAAAVQTQRRATLTQLDALLQSTFLHMFGDPVTNPKGWKITELAELCAEVVDCPHSTPVYELNETTYACVRSSDIQNGYFDWSSTKYVSYEEYEKRITRLKPISGDVVYCREGARFGNAARVDEAKQICLGQRMMMFRPKGSISTSEFIWAVLESSAIKRQASLLVGGSASPHLNVKDIKSFQVIVPPLSLQERFSKIVKNVDSQRNIYARVVQTFDVMFSSLQQRAFRGELSPSP